MTAQLAVYPMAISANTPHSLILLEINQSIKGGEEKHYYHKRSLGTLEIRCVPSQPRLSPSLKGRGPPGQQAATYQGPSLTGAQVWGSKTWGSHHQETPLTNQGSFATMDSSSQDCMTKTVTGFLAYFPNVTCSFVSALCSHVCSTIKTKSNI